MENKHLSKAKAIKKLNASEDKLQRWCKNGKLHPQKLGSGNLVFKREEIESLQRRRGKLQVKQQTEKPDESKPGSTVKPKPRLLLILKDTDQTQRILPTFEQFLKSYDLKIVKRHKHQTENLIEIIINAYKHSEVRWVSNLARDFLGTAIVNIESRY
jgi:hypothetical protein